MNKRIESRRNPGLAGLLGTGIALLAAAAAWAQSGAPDPADPPGLRGRRLPGGTRPPLREGQPARERMAPAARAGDGAMPSRTVPADAGSGKAPLLVCIGLHIEPLGAEVSALTGRPPRPAGLRPPGQNAGMAGRGRGDYGDRAFFERHVDSIRRVTAIVEQGGGRFTVQAQTPFTRVCAESHIPILAELLDRGHELGLHFHEDAHLGPRCETLPASAWTAVMREEMDWIRKACPGAKIRYWSGGNNYPDLLRAAADAGLEVMSDHKNPRRQQSFPELLAVQPWRPAGGPTEEDIAQFARHDPEGRIVYLPDGVFPDSDFAARKRDGDAAYLDAITEGLELSLRAARPDRVNVFHMTIHPAELRGAPDAPFAAFGAWMQKVMAPLSRDGRVRWATFSQMADAYREWEKAHPGVDPRAPSTRGDKPGTPAARAPDAAATASPAPQATGVLPALPAGKKGWITFAVNTHDTVHTAESADTIHRLIGMFRGHGVRGDFYFTAPIVEAYARERPELIRELKDSGMGINYHLRPPHPAISGFDRRLRPLDDAALEATLRDFETYRTDPATGGLQEDRPGGYRLVADTFGCRPVCVSTQAQDPRIRGALCKVLREMGARVGVFYHETGTDPDRPFEWLDGLLARPSDFSITRWSESDGGNEEFWWNRVSGPRADPTRFDPSARLAQNMAAWKGPRPPFVTALIHENNFPRFGPEAWKAFYFTDPAGRTPRQPPYDLSAPDPSRARSAGEREAIFRAYDRLVAAAAKSMQVVTAADIADMAGPAPKR